MRRGFTIHHNGPPASCVGKTHDRCVAFWSAVRNYHLSKGWSDIAYSFGVCPHGVRFTGRGWDRNQWANGSDVVGPDDGADAYWYTVLVFIGTDEAPTVEMVDGVRELIGEGRASGRCGNRVLPHNAFKVKACPGPEFTEYAAQWDNAPLSDPQGDSDDMTADQAKMLLDTFGGVAHLITLVDRLQADLNTNITETRALAAALGAIAAGEGLDPAELQQTVEDAVKAALREGTG